MRRRMLALCTLAVGLITSGAVAGCSTYHVTEVHGYEVKGTVSHLRIEANEGAVRVTVGDGPVRVTETWRYHSHKPKTSHTNDGGTLRLTSDDCDTPLQHCAVDYDVRLPANVSVDINDTAGPVQLSGIAGDVQIRNTSGSVQATGLTSPHTTVRDKAGRVRLEYAAAPSTVDVADTAGVIEVWVPSGDAYAVDAHTKAGEQTVDVQQDPASPRKITLQDTAGRITVGTGRPTALDQSLRRKFRCLARDLPMGSVFAVPGRAWFCRDG